MPCQREGPTVNAYQFLPRSRARAGPLQSADEHLVLGAGRGADGRRAAHDVDRLAGVDQLRVFDAEHHEVVLDHVLHNERGAVLGEGRAT
jgi:hypothetical protein